MYRANLIKMVATVWLCLMVIPCAQAQERDAHGLVTILQGTADKRPTGGDWGKLVKREPVVEGDRVKTFENSLAEITLHQTQKIRLGPLTTVDFDAVFADGERTVSELEIEEGDMWAEVETLNEASSFNINSNVAHATVRGTAFSVHAGRDGTALSVYHGAVEVRGRQAGSNIGKASLPEGEISGPREVAGPREVSLHEWVQIIGNMQQIMVAPDGSWQVRDIKEDDKFSHRWQQWNARLDQ